MKPILAASLLSCAIAGFALLAACSTSNQGPESSRESSPGSTGQGDEQPGAENKVTLKDLNGTYYFGDGLGVNCTLELDPSGRFSFRWRGCLGEYDRNEGPIRMQDGFLRLEPECPNIREGFKGVATVLLPVRWSTRTYLIPREELPNFINEINQGGEPRDHVHGRFFVRKEDWKAKAVGLPDLPLKWKNMILPKAIEGKVLAIDASRFTISLGKEQGAWEGMILTAHIKATPGFCQLRVVSVSDSSCVATFQYRSTNELEVGNSVTSQFQQR
jgi:hypothetical protein